MAETVGCLHCKAVFHGEAFARPLRVWATFRVPSRGLVIEPTGAIPWRCPRCHWVTIFEPVAETQPVA